MIIAAIVLAAFTVFLVLFHSIRRTSPNIWVAAPISLCGAALSFFFGFNSKLQYAEAMIGVFSLIVTLSGSIVLMKLHHPQRMTAGSLSK